MFQYPRFAELLLLEKTLFKAFTSILILQLIFDIVSINVEDIIFLSFANTFLMNN